MKERVRLRTHGGVFDRGLVEKIVTATYEPTEHWDGKSIGKVKLSRPAKPKKLSFQEETQQVLDTAEVTYAPSGRRSWAACGHPAELDIDNHCYTCHEAVA